MTKKTLEIAKQAALKSATKIKKIYATFDRTDLGFKSKHEVISKADILSEKIIIKEIKKHFPEHRILSEEIGDNKKESDYLWIIDPIDGSTNFSIRNPLWAISIGLAYKNELIMGLVYAPILEEMFSTIKDQGAHLNNKKINVSKIKNNNAIHTFCHGSTEKHIKRALKYYQKQKLNSTDCRQLGSASMELAYVACGRIESIAIPGANSWDVAAGALLVQEAGGRVSDFDNKKWNIKSSDILASNKIVHSQIIKSLK